MSQYSFGNLESPLTGTALINTHLEPWRDALHSTHSGTSRPAYAEAGTIWIDNSSSPWVLNVFDGSDDISVGEIDTSTNTFKSTADIQANTSSGIRFYNDAGTLIGTLGASTSTGATWVGQHNFSGVLQAQGKFSVKAAGELTISTGAVAITGANHVIDTESDAATDDLDTITGGVDGAFLVLRAANTARTVVIKDSTGNITTPDGSSIYLNNTSKAVILGYDATLANWLVLSIVEPHTVNAIGAIGGGTQDVDVSEGRTVTATVDVSTTTFTFSNPSISDAFDLILTNGGSQTINWPASVIWAGGTAPTLTASGVDHLVFTTPDQGTTWYGYVAGLDMS